MAQKKTTKKTAAAKRSYSTEPKKKRKKMTPKELGIVIGSIILALVLIVMMVLHAPYLKDADGQPISLWDKLIYQPILNEQEGDLSSKSNESYVTKSEVNSERNDGLDLNQRIEGQFTILFHGFDESRSNADVNMLVMFDIAGNKIQILQIPRDTFVPDYTSFAAGKFNSVYTMGDPDLSQIQRTVDCIEETFQIPIDSYVTTACTDIVDIVDLIGGVEIDMPYTINYEPGKTIYQGPQTLSGQKAEWMLRYRHGYNEGDIGRMQAQRIFLAAAMKKVADTGTITMMGYMKEIYDKKLIATDLTLDEMSKLSDFAIAIGMENIHMYLLPGEGYNYYPEGSSKYYSVWAIHKAEVINLLNQHFRPYLERAYELPITELVKPEDYKTDAYDNNQTDLQNVYNGNTFQGH